jgi:hypothetical protein
MKFRLGSLVIMSALVIGGAVVACGDDDSTPATPKPDGGDTADSGGGDAATAGTIEGTATYQGDKKGPLIVGVFKEPPNPAAPKPPAYLGSVESPTWPGSNPFSVKNVAPGTYYVSAYIMVGPEHRQQGAQAGDPVALPQQVTVGADGKGTTTLNLIDRVPDAGADAGDAGDDAGDGG